MPRASSVQPGLIARELAIACSASRHSGRVTPDLPGPAVAAGAGPRVEQLERALCSSHSVGRPSAGSRRTHRLCRALCRAAGRRSGSCTWARRPARR
jgi:hypothetical protein